MIKLKIFGNICQNFHANCIGNQNFNQICSNEANTNSGIIINEINNCLFESFSGTSYEKQQTEYQKKKNFILDKE
mgnify:CR=1 FL=1